MKPVVTVIEQVPVSGVIEAKAPVQLVGLAGQSIQRLEINGFDVPGAGQWLLIVAPESEGLEIDELVITGNPSRASRQDWNDTAHNGALIASGSVSINRCTLSGLHVGLELAGDSITVMGVDAGELSGDVIQGKGSNCMVLGVVCRELYRTRDPALYHADIVQWRDGADCVVVDGCRVEPSGHAWSRADYQGVMFSDGVYRGCHVTSCRFPGVHAAHGVTFAEAHDCHVESIWGGGAVRFRDLNGVLSTGCTAVDCDGLVQGVEVEVEVMAKEQVQIFDPVMQFNLGDPSDDAVGILFNNPMAVKKYETWQHELPREQWPDYMRRSRNDLLRFVSPEWGIRCGVHILLGYQRRKGLNSVRKIVNEWAPSAGKGADNTKTETSEYVLHVARALGVSPDETIAVSDYATARTLTIAIIERENNWAMPYSDGMIDLGLALAGIKLPGETPAETKPPAQSGERRGATVIAGGSAVGVGATVTTWIASQTGLSAEQAGVLVDSAADAAGNAAAAVSTLDWIRVLVIGQSICWVVVGVGAWWWYRSRDRARLMGLR